MTLAHRLTKDRFQGDETVQILVSITFSNPGSDSDQLLENEAEQKLQKCDTEHRSQAGQAPRRHNAGVIVKAIHVGRTWIEFEVKYKRAGCIRGGHARIHADSNDERVLNFRE